MLLINLGLALAFMSLAWLLAYKRQRLDSVDVAWGLGFILLAWAAYFQHTGLRLRLVAVLVTIWGLRLTVHIYMRTRFRGDDPRYRELTKRWRGSIWRRAYYSIFLLQGFLVWLISLPVVMQANSELGHSRWIFTIGLAVWIIGFFVEAVADRQLQNFLRDKSRPKVMQTGLWRYSRHPNYFGELVQWWAIGIMALANSWGWLGLIGPAVLTYLIVFVSGLPPIEQRHAKDPAYADYIHRTSPLIPLPPRKQ